MKGRKLRRRNRLNFLASIFVNKEEQRLRSGWRLLLHLIWLSVLIFFIYYFLQALASLSPVLAFLSDDIFITLAAITLTVFIARRWLDRRSFQSLGLEWNGAAIQDILVGILIPLPLFGLIFLAELSLGWLDFKGFAWQTEGGAIWIDMGYWAAVFIMVGWYEELLSRGYWLQNLAEGLNMPLALFISSAIFSLAHFANPSASWASGIGILAAGYFLAYGYLRTKQLWLPIGLHIGWNFFEGPVFGFPVSGLDMPRLLQHEVSGPALFTGGGFGPEAGLIVLPAMGIGAIMIYYYTEHLRGALEE